MGIGESISRKITSPGHPQCAASCSDETIPERDFEQLRRSWYVLFFQLPWLPEAGMRADNWRGAVRALRRSGGVHTFTNEDIEKYKEAWSQPGAMTAMINWYRAAFRYSADAGGCADTRPNS